MGALLLLLWGLAWAEVHRFALLVANNEGQSPADALIFAEADARRVEGVLLGPGGFEPEEITLLFGRSRAELLAAFSELRRAILVARDEGQPGDEVLFLFYYSGHADSDGLQLGRTRMAYDEVERLLDQSGADVRIALLDACNSGELTRAKGGTLAPSFVYEVTERLGAQGTVIITSSTGDEASQESDEVGGSYFTYYLTSGLSGAADADADGKVTLAEVYGHVYRETVLRTSETRLGAQHPSFDWDIAGAGDVVLTDLDPARAGLYFPAAMGGTVAVFDLERRLYVGEVQAGGVDRRLSVRPGRYLLQVRYPTHLRVAEVRVSGQVQVDVSALTFRTVEYQDDVAKGAIERQARQERRPDSALRLLAGVGSVVQPAVRAEYLPDTALGGVAWRLDWRQGQWLGVDLLGGAGLGQIVLPELGGQALPTRSSTASLGLSVGYATPEWTRLGLQAGAGLRGAGTWIGRSVYEGQTPSEQYALTLSPGAVAFVGAHPGRLVLDLEWQRMRVPFALSEDVGHFSTRAVLLTAGVRW